ncbi:MAG: hypothetical protein ACTSQE_06730 [Candidatus Heimdallarchaeaceae archaeon]
MDIYKGDKGLKHTWQEPFPKTMKCHKCEGEARIMFVGIEDNEEEFISSIRENGGDGDFWVHDVIACAVYLCKDCFEPNVILNQA